MQPKIAACLLALAGTGCVVQPAEPVTDEAATEIEAPDALDTGPETLPVVVEPAPNLCELLLSSLDETRPLLSSLGESLTAQSAAMEQALAELARPAPVPAAECAPGSGDMGGKEIIGALEWLYLDSPGEHFRARVDSGAETSALSVGDIVEFERDGDDWVRFDFEHDSSDDVVELELPVTRVVRVRRGPGIEPERRHVVAMDVRLGDQLQSAEFTLTDKALMNYPVMLGRAFLMDLYVVDVSRTYTHDR